MIVASFFAPRPEHPRWRDYLQSLALLQTSCDRLGLQHVVIGDAPVTGFDVLQVPDLPRDLMPAILLGQKAALQALDDDILLVGADCVIATDTSAALSDADIAVTLGDFWDCRLNTGAIWVRREARLAAADLWGRALAAMGASWGDDQLALADQFAPLPEVPGLLGIRAGLRVNFLDVDPWNLAPRDVNDDCSRGRVLHFRGPRKDWSAAWCARFLGFGG